MQIAAHRGYRAKYPENTMLAFEKALALKIDMIEFDLNLTKDKHLVVIHDQTVDRTTNGTGAIRDMTLEEVQQLDAGGWFDEKYKGLQIPTFKTFCELLVNYPEIGLNVEIKERTHETVDLTIQMLKDVNMMERCIFTCCDAQMLHYLVDTHHVKTQGFLDDVLDNYNPQEASLDDKLEAIGISMNLLTKETVKQCEAKGILPWAYSPDTEEEVIKARDLGAKLITCNDPVPAIKVIHNQ